VEGRYKEAGRQKKSRSGRHENLTLRTKLMRATCNGLLNLTWLPGTGYCHKGVEERYGTRVGTGLWGLVAIGGQGKPNTKNHVKQMEREEDDISF